MFRHKSAWFSDSVKTDIVGFWVSQGGSVCDWEKADYLFSDDASRPDTHRIHVSEAYAMDRVTVFHSAYLYTCALRRSVKSVPLGHYLLPPPSVQSEVKARFGRFIWEQQETLGLTTPHGDTEQILNSQEDSKEKERKRQEKCTDTPPSQDTGCFKAQIYSGYVHINQLQKFSGELHDFLPSHFGYSVSQSH